MPVYDYWCLACDKEFQKLINMSDFDKTKYIKCEHCGEDAQRQLSRDVQSGEPKTVGTLAERNSCNLNR